MTLSVSCAGCDMYCTLADLLEQVPERTLIQLTNEELDFDSPATVKTEVVDSCIRYADELIDAHLRRTASRTSIAPLLPLSWRKTTVTQSWIV